MMKTLFLLITLFVFNAYSQSENSVDKFEKIKTERLKRIRREMIQVESQMFSLKKRIESEQDMVAKLKLESQLLEFQNEYDQKSTQFIETATGQYFSTNKQPIIDKKDISQDIQDLLGPALKGIKKASERPRKIQKLEEDLADVSKRLEEIEIAHKKLEELKTDPELKELKRSINKSLNVITSTEKELKIQKEDIEFKLLKLRNQKGSIVTAISNLILNFFKSKGKNLILALLSFMFLFWVLKKGQSGFIRIIMGQVTKRAENPARVSWVVRPIRVIYSVMTILLSLVVAIMTLYALDDWVLVTFIIILIGAFVWSSKQYIPIFLEQSKMVLNLGSVREGERVVYNGLSWKVQGLGYYCRLVNPALSGGFLRINTRELLHSHSRPIIGNEIWFPTRLNDWVELNDGTYGKVVTQTPEQVAVKLIGDAVKFFSTTDFVSLNPINLSNNFGLEVVLGIDYQHQAIILDEIIPNLKNQVSSDLEEAFANDSKHFIECSVEFMQANTSSLDIRFFIKCAGPLASQKSALVRKIQTSFVQVCNDKGYVIPFNQLTVHLNQ